ncbi:hypothetical protein EW146_g6291 [Bondarzewia mesenterica]|uniref:Bromo domain-containing protein n=1 Tax=Bondarzewia mesenterica TaxID=1095465 RepID=A0A4S4LQW0_9AGAM|nr:hypothetical protein EW146_g6291 [Bondarzewia mesenterica]
MIPSADKGRVRRRMTRNVDAPKMGLKKLGVESRGLMVDEEGSKEGVVVVGKEDRGRGKKGRKKRGRESLSANKLFRKDELQRQTREIMRDKENLHVWRSLVTNEIVEITNKIDALDAIRAKLDDDILNFQKDDGEEIGRLRGHTGTVKCVQVEDNVCLTGSENGNVRVWDQRRVDEDEWEGGMVHLSDVVEEAEDENAEGVVVEKPNGIRDGEHSYRIMYSQEQQKQRALSQSLHHPMPTGAADAHQASSHTAAAPPPASTSSTVVDASSRTSTLSNVQYKYCLSILRMLKKQKDAFSFRMPVDPVLYNIPHYFQIIKHPMDLSTMEHKLLSSNPIKPNPNPVNPRYFNVAEFEADFCLIVRNCETFNGSEHLITQQGKRLAENFDKMMRAMPAPEIPKPPVIKKPPTPPPLLPPTLIIKKPPCRSSTSVPIIRWNNMENLGRPKREIHPPPPKDLPYADALKKHRRRGKKNNNEQLRFCGKLLDQLHRKQHQNVVGSFAQPVDPVALNILDYPSIIKKPMDLSTMHSKLEGNMYPTAEKFRDDFKLMINNCVKYNGTQSAIAEAGFALQRLFNEKWQNLPPLHPEVSDEEEDEDKEDDE